jgi:hypothetical protein
MALAPAISGFRSCLYQRHQCKSVVSFLFPAAAWLVPDPRSSVPSVFIHGKGLNLPSLFISVVSANQWWVFCFSQLPILAIPAILAIFHQQLPISKPHRISFPHLTNQISSG